MTRRSGRWAMGLRISINAKRIDGPWGGGAHSARALERHFAARGHYVTRALEPGLDAVVLHSLRPNGESTSYSPDSVRRHRQACPHAAVVTRVNTCDEHQAADRGLNRMVLDAAELADAVVFLSDFSRELFLAQGLDPSKPSRVIRTGANAEVFHPAGRAPWAPGQRIRLVTHHWSPWVMKGIDVYERLDYLLAEPDWADKFEFTYVGRLPLGFRLPHSRCLPVMEGKDLADELRRHHAYLTGARHEAAGNHYIEAMRCGLPVLYLQSGANAEYCGPYGIGFHPGNFEAKLRQLREEYPRLRQAVLDCPYDAEIMAAEYLSLIESVVAARRTAPRQPPAPHRGWRRIGSMMRGLWQGARQPVGERLP